MSAQVSQMIGRFQKTGLKLFSESTKALANPTIQYAIGAILVLYITFLESETESILSVAMTNPLGRLLILLLLLLLVSVSVPLGILFAILIVMSCANRENFTTVPVHNFTLPSNPPTSNFENEDEMEKIANAAKNGGTFEEGDGNFEEQFLASHGMSPELKIDGDESFQVPEPAGGTKPTDGDTEGEIEGFSAKTTHSVF